MAGRLGAGHAGPLDVCASDENLTCIQCCRVGLHGPDIKSVREMMSIGRVQYAGANVK